MLTGGDGDGDGDGGDERAQRDNQPSVNSDLCHRAFRTGAEVAEADDLWQLVPYWRQRRHNNDYGVNL